MKCSGCGGTGTVYEQHDFASEPLGCPDCEATGEVTTRWFSFGVEHRHVVAGQVFDGGTIARVTAPDPRAVMLAVFGQAWCWEYSEPPTHPLMRDLPVVDVTVLAGSGS